MLQSKRQNIRIWWEERQVLRIVTHGGGKDSSRATRVEPAMDITARASQNRFVPRVTPSSTPPVWNKKYSWDCPKIRPSRMIVTVAMMSPATTFLWSGDPRSA